ncbi:Ribosomal_protein L7 [Hexamita inflata]|uniref:Ribosomal protein L7 n=1 Tax=Hexamita inflata TaxID=28002 RepID=A0AA86R9Z8_9EUKA|nr:Ribosomal protein L7 [Hexamita inflata]CAI9968788.1 Ribosomal protein L7 [Hexamita inflata]
MVVPEQFIKARKAANARASVRAELLKKQNERNEKLAVHALKVAEAYTKEYTEAKVAQEKLIKETTAKGGFVIAAEPKVLLVIRLRGLKACSPKTRAILNLFRLRQINNAVFIRVNKATMNALKLVEPYVTYGEPTLETVRSLLYKRGYGKIDNQRIPIFDNTVVDEQLGAKNIKCMEDLVHEIHVAGPNFKAANNFIWPFKLNPTELNAKRHHFIEGGDHGNRGKYINDFVAKMI